MIAKCTYLSNPMEIKLVERELKLEDNEVLVKTHRSSVCDADLRAWKGLYMPEDLPSFATIGHEGGGTIVEIGSKVTDFKVGDMVMAFGPHNLLSNYFKAPVQNLHMVPEGLDMDIACLGEPACVGMYGVFCSGVRLGDTVLVAGLNFQGQIGVEGLKKMGASMLIAVDYSDAHLDLAKKHGADIIINTKREDAKKILMELTGNKGVDVSFHSCGYWNPRSEEYFNLCIDTTRDEGIISSIPDIMSPIKVNTHRLHHHAMDLRFSAVMHHGPEFRKRWVPRLMQPIVKGLIDIKSLITDIYPLSRIDEAFVKFNEDEDQIKIYIDPDK